LINGGIGIMRAKGNVALVTGAAQGLGQSIALALALKGFKLALNDTSNKRQQLSQVVDAIREQNGEAIAVVADVTNPAEVLNMVEQIGTALGGINVLVNNAGNNRNSLMRNANLTDLNAVVSVHLAGSFNCMQAVLEQMRQQNYGRIINITSVVGMTGITGTPYYAAAKASLLGLTRATAAEVAKHGITVNALAAGYVDTGMGLQLTEDLKDKITSRIPMGRFAKPDEVAETVCFLASPQASYITGTIVNVSGGFYM